MVDEQRIKSIVNGMLPYLEAIEQVITKACEEKDQGTAEAGLVLVKLMAEFSDHATAVVMADKLAKDLQKVGMGFNQEVGDAMYNLAFGEAYKQIRAKKL